MQHLQQLRSGIHVMEDLQVVVRTMKAMARVALRRYETARESIHDYAANVDLALHAFLQERRFSETGELPSFLAAGTEPAAERVGLILFGSDHGLCGTFNERMQRRHADLLEHRGLDHRLCRHVVVGRRLSALMGEDRDGAGGDVGLPHSVEGIAPLIQKLMLLIEQWRFGAEPVEQILIIHHRMVAAARSEVAVRQLLPLERSRLQRLWSVPWPSQARPMLFGQPADLFSAILREMVTVTLHQAAIESLASENAARLDAMHAAERHLEERLADLNLEYRRERQSAITAELLDVVAGFEALQQGD
jgi:F-type H+-transporting ATPase subunit gamma